MTDADEAFGQHVQKETAQELVGAKSHCAGLATVGVILPAESHALLVEGQQAMIGNGHAMGPAGEAIDYVLTRKGVSNIWRQNLAGGTPKQITNFESGRIFDFDWSRDGKQLALTRGSESSDVILITNFR